VRRGEAWLAREGKPNQGPNDLARNELLSDFLPENGRVSRRTLIKYGGLLGAAGLVSTKELTNPSTRLLGGPSIVVVDLTRREDMMCLRFEFINMFLTDEPPRLIRGESGPAYMIVHFPPQAIAEQALAEYTGDPKLPTPPLKSRVADPSRIAFSIPITMSEIPFTMQSIMNWTQFSPSVVPVVRVKRPVRGRPYREPFPEETSIEAPYRIVVSPPNDHRWRHETYPNENNGRTDLWRTTLVGPNATPTKPKLRAVWTRNFQRTTRPSSSSDQFTSSLDNEDRWQIIRNSSDWTTYTKPIPIDVNEFSLSALGAWIDVEGNWVPKGVLSLEQWKHQGVQGRDNYVKVVKQGFLYPFGHKAALTTITQRKLQYIEAGVQKGRLAAFLRQRIFITVRERVKTYSRNDMPFRRIEIHSLQTPDLNPPKDSSVVGNGKAFWPRVGTGDFRFLMSALDKDSKLVWFTAPLIYVNASWLDKIGTISRSYANSSFTRSRILMNGQDVSLAPSANGTPGETSMPTKYLEFGSETFASGKPNFRPRMKFANIRLKALEEIKGKAFSQSVQYHQAYKESGFGGQNQDAQVFLKLLTPTALDFAEGADGDKAGGLATPNMKIGGLSRQVGPIAGDLANGKVPTKFDPKEFFKDAKVLGGIELAEIIKVLDTVRKAPKMFTKAIHPFGNKLLPPEKIVTEFLLHLEGNEVKSDPAKLFEPLPNGSLDLHATFVTPLFGGIPEYKVVGELKNFKLYMVGKPDAFLILTFNRLKFASETGKAPDVDVDIDKVEFAGALQFINDLKNYMNFGGNGLNIDVSPQQIEAGYTLAIPTITTGIFTLANVSLAAGVTIPFTGKPFSARFAFCRPDAQFLLTYTIFGGGGFAQIAVGADPKEGKLGIEILEIGLEFGAAASINLGVASGGVQIMAGIYFKIANLPGCAAPSVQLSGYVRLGGELDVLGIINISIEFRMSLNYDSADGSVWGQATLVVEVDVLFISKSVELTVEKRFGGGGGTGALCAPGAASAMELLGPGPPTPNRITFGDLMDADPPDQINDIWEEEYAPAFASAAFV
jgi:hypothetical protein